MSGNNKAIKYGISEFPEIRRCNGHCVDNTRGNPYILLYRTPSDFDDIVITGDDDAVTGVHFTERNIDGNISVSNAPLPLREACRWLDVYFSGREPGFLPPYRLERATDFRRKVAELMLRIPFGATETYGGIANVIAKTVSGRMSAQAVGGAVGWNPIGIIIPCHRVIGTDGSLTGYGGGMRNKIALLAHERASLKRL